MAREVDLLLAEVDSSISYISIEFVVCTVLLLFAIDSLGATPFAVIALSTSMMGLLYSGLCFAIVGGQMARGGADIRAAKRSMERGNILSEWYGMYLLLFAFPIVIEAKSGSSLLGGVAVVANLGGYAVYVSTNSDLLGRFIRGRPRVCLHATFSLSLALHWAGVALDWDWLEILGGGLFLVLVICCSAVHWRRGEFLTPEIGGVDPANDGRDTE